MPKTPHDTRARIIEAADELFYEIGIRTVSMDAIAEKAGLTKRSLYYHFRSKDDLVAAYLQARDEPTIARYAKWVDLAQGPLEQQIAALFHKVALAGKNPKWKGCGFLRAAAELANMPGHPARKAGAEHKKKLEAWLASRISAEGLRNAPMRARQIMVLLDGAAAEMLIHRDPAYAEAAGRAAAELLASKG